MRRRTIDVLAWGFLVTVFLVILAAPYFIMRATCHGRWADSGMATSFGVLGGCRVQLPDGRWVPEDRVRETDLEPKPR